VQSITLASWILDTFRDLGSLMGPRDISGRENMVGSLYIGGETDEIRKTGWSNINIP